MSRESFFADMGFAGAGDINDFSETTSCPLEKRFSHWNRHMQSAWTLGSVYARVESSRARRSFLMLPWIVEYADRNFFSSLSKMAVFMTVIEPRNMLLFHRSPIGSSGPVYH